MGTHLQQALACGAGAAARELHGFSQVSHSSAQCLPSPPPPAFAPALACCRFAVMQPLAKPLPGLWNRGWLHPVGDTALCAARCLPAALIVFYDAQV